MNERGAPGDDAPRHVDMREPLHLRAGVFGHLQKESAHRKADLISPLL